MASNSPTEPAYQWQRTAYEPTGLQPIQLVEETALTWEWQFRNSLIHHVFKVTDNGLWNPSWTHIFQVQKIVDCDLKSAVLKTISPDSAGKRSLESDFWFQIKHCRTCALKPRSPEFLGLLQISVYLCLNKNKRGGGQWATSETGCSLHTQSAFSNITGIFGAVFPSAEQHIFLNIWLGGQDEHLGGPSPPLPLASACPVARGHKKALNPCTSLPCTNSVKPVLLTQWLTLDCCCRCWPENSRWGFPHRWASIDWFSYSWPRSLTPCTHQAAGASTMVRSAAGYGCSCRGPSQGPCSHQWRVQPPPICRWKTERPCHSTPR